MGTPSHHRQSDFSDRRSEDGEAATAPRTEKIPYASQQGIEAQVNPQFLIRRKSSRCRSHHHDMKRVTIDLAGPFEEIVAKLSSVPPTDNFIERNGTAVFELSPEVQDVLRHLYEAARGRQFATVIGLIPVGPPPIAPFLKDAPFEVESQTDFLLQALARLYSGSAAQVPSRKTNKETSHPKAESRRAFGHRQQRISHAVKQKRNHDQPAHSHHNSPS
ncbi:MAG TPA: hypothetical protein VGI85_10180 [Chthoniobacterales bacterium]